jgi:hypothetical protein
LVQDHGGSRLHIRLLGLAKNDRRNQNESHQEGRRKKESAARVNVLIEHSLPLFFHH